VVNYGKNISQDFIFYFPQKTKKEMEIKLIMQEERVGGKLY